MDPLEGFTYRGSFSNLQAALEEHQVSALEGHHESEQQYVDRQSRQDMDFINHVLQECKRDGGDEGLIDQALALVEYYRDEVLGNVEVVRHQDATWNPERTLLSRNRQS